MASSSGVWGIEIGQSALKALHCKVVDGEVVADAFDFIEYPKILSQPEAVPEELIDDALQQLLQRNDGFNDQVVISVPGQSGLAKFFKPPPVEIKKIADIVRYEARQQIPFDLADVVWDHQMMPGSMIEEGYALESEVGLFAMKREQVYRQLQPFTSCDIEVDQIQLAPLALYNMVAYDRLHDRIENETFDSDNPPASVVVLSIGTDSSDLIITNGFRIWQRSMPIGGNHFTRQLTKDLKLTFANAEHLKRNAREAADPKLVFQTMRPVFNDLVTEVQRSIGFFRSIDRQAEISEMLIAGNTVKMPGLAAYLGKNLGFEVSTLDRFNRLSGEDVLSIPTFRDNATTFGVCYGLCLQGLDLAPVHASLVPQEILTERMIRAKKPWTLAAVAALLLGLIGHYVLTERSWAHSHPDLWDGAQAAVTQMSSYSNEQKSEDELLQTKLTFLNQIGKEVSGDAEKRLKWMELLRAFNTMVPRMEFPDGKRPSVKELPYEDRTDIHVTKVETKFYEDLSTWYTDLVKKRFKEEMLNWVKITGRPLPDDMLEPMAGAVSLATAAPTTTSAVSYGTPTSSYGSTAVPMEVPLTAEAIAANPALGVLAELIPPSGPGWVIEISAYHYFNSPEMMGKEGSNHVRNFLTTNFLTKPIALPDPEGNLINFTPREFGFSYPLLLQDYKPKPVQIANPAFDPDAVMMAQQALATGVIPMGQTEEGLEEIIAEPRALTVQRLDFDYQVVWQPTLITDRIKAKNAAEAAAAAAAEAEAVAMPPTPTP
ncbi:type IV pilus assembly protein PilM [Novipirellula artificiosorum]|uniref:Competence protein A n=1 Tax=Novipirellula artificiosorum TaxID=2528016 RepID=A0A5C6D6Z8_9BACT|nr:type IV pilus assembly protein PilM [Novipirellula artificiosorum]TWU31016.1 Competence protein A [Novipirellula artificiosorum]